MTNLVTNWHQQLSALDVKVIYCLSKCVVSVICLLNFDVLFSSDFRREAVQVRVRRLRPQIRQQLRPQEALPRAHLGQALQLQDQVSTVVVEDCHKDFTNFYVWDNKFHWNRRYYKVQKVLKIWTWMFLNYSYSHHPGYFWWPKESEGMNIHVSIPPIEQNR